ncbi:PAS domain S-box protein [Candidatus Fermentibacteria bacterium]|nr:PAS domain S-box protein [Candidatus Fermentibacteria bacterium]
MKDERKTKKQLIEELNELRDRLDDKNTHWWRTLVDSVPDIIMTVHRDGAITYINHAIPNLPPEKVVGRNVADFALPEHLDITMSTIERVFDSKEAASFEGAGTAGPEGDVVYASTHIGPLIEHGQVVSAILVIRDVTARVQAEEELLDSQKRLQDIAFSSGDWIWEVDAEARFTFAAGRVKQILGYGPEELIGKTPFELMPENEAKRVGEIFEGIASRKAPVVDLENRNLTREGDIVHILTNGVPLLGEDGELLGYRGVDKDITDRKRRERELRQAEQLYSSVVEGSKDAIIIHQDGVIKFVNSAACEQTGFSRDELVGREMLSFVVPEDRELAGKRVADKLAGKPVPGLYEISVISKEGPPIPVEINAGVIDYDAKPAILVFFRDLTERKEAEKAIRESEREKQLILDSSPILIAYQNLEHEVIWANRVAVESVNLSMEDKVGRKCYELWAGREEPCADCPVEKAWETGDHATGQIETPDGRIWLISGSPTRDEQGCIDGAVETTLNVTDRIRAERSKALLEDELKQAQKLESIGKLAGGVAHDLNNLLSPIIGYSEMLLQDATVGHRQQRPVREIHDAGLKARELISQLLAFSRKQALELRVVDLNELVANFEKLLRRTIRENIEIDLNLSPLVRPVRADSSQIEQVIMNLVVNAQDAMPDGGRIMIETDVVALDEDYMRSHQGVIPGEYVMLAISDTGVGMNAEVRERIFEPFFTTKGEEEGTGLGLSTAYGIVKQHEGSIWVYSESGRGTTCKVYLPVTREEVPEARKRSKPLENVQGSETILLAEDNQQVRDLALEILELHGYRVLVAENGRQALSQISAAEGSVQLLLTDVVMPDIDGRELYNRISRSNPGLKVLFMSGYTADAIEQQGISEERFSFLQKPFTVQDLLSGIREVLDDDS